MQCPDLVAWIILKIVTANTKTNNCNLHDKEAKMYCTKTNISLLRVYASREREIENEERNIR